MTVPWIGVIEAPFGMGSISYWQVVCVCKVGPAKLRQRCATQTCRGVCSDRENMSMENTGTLTESRTRIKLSTSMTRWGWTAGTGTGTGAGATTGATVTAAASFSASCFLDRRGMVDGA